MSSRRRRSCAPRLLCCALAALAALSGCRADEPAPSDAKTEAAAEKKPVIDQKIESAVAAAQKSAGSVNPAAPGQLTPPEDGILDAAAAALEVAPGSAAQLVFGGAGADPKLTLGGPVQTSALTRGHLEVSYRSGSGAMPTVDFELQLKAAVSAAGAVPAEGDVTTRFMFASAGLGATQPGRLPENARAEIAKLKGSSVEFVTSPRGASKGFRFALGGDNPGLVPLVMGGAEALASVVLPYPEQPVGSGAFWMVKSRETLNGAQVLAYRMVKVSQVSGDAAQLEVVTRRYLLEAALPMASLPPHRVRQFESEGKATLSVRAGTAYPTEAEVEDTFTAILSLNERPNQPAPLQSEVHAKLQLTP